MAPVNAATRAKLFLKMMASPVDDSTISIRNMFLFQAGTDLGMCAATDTGRAVYDLSEESGRRDSLPSASSSSSSLSSDNDLFFGPQRAPSEKRKISHISITG